jgi:predicted ArsR family transcriptional regulator
MTEPAPIEVHKALADETRYRLYRFLRLAGRAVPVRELATRLSLHPNTVRPHLRRLEEAGLVATETRRGAGVGRPQTLYSVVELDARQGRDYRLLADILSSLLSGTRQRERAEALARQWGEYLVRRSAPRPGARRSPGPNLAALQEAMSEAGFDPRFHRRGTASVELSMRDCPFRELLDDHLELVCAVHRGLIEGMFAASGPPMQLTSLEPLVDRTTVCRVRAEVTRPTVR